MLKTIWYVLNGREVYGAFDNLEDAKNYANLRPGYFVISAINHESL